MVQEMHLGKSSSGMEARLRKCGENNKAATLLVCGQPASITSPTGSAPERK
jgi:hypothetical protein